MTPLELALAIGIAVVVVSAVLWWNFPAIKKKLRIKSGGGPGEER